MSPTVDGLDSWWEGLLAASLVGTARREVPPLPALGVAQRDSASREEALLDAAALGDAVRRAGAAVEKAGPLDEPATADTREAAPSPAVQILELLLTQGPVAAAARDLLARHWLETAAAANRVVPPRLLPALLELGTTRPAAVRRAIAAAVGERGAWLAARNPEWQWLATPDDVRETVGGAGRGPRPQAIRPVRRPRAGRGDVGDRRRPGPRHGSRVACRWASGPTTRPCSSAASTTGPSPCARKPRGCSTGCPVPPEPLGWPTGSGHC